MWEWGVLMTSVGQCIAFGALIQTAQSLDEAGGVIEISLLTLTQPEPSDERALFEKRFAYSHQNNSPLSSISNRKQENAFFSLSLRLPTPATKNQRKDVNWWVTQRSKELV